MTNTTTTKETVNLLADAKQRIIDDMKVREIGAIIWSVPDAGFHFIPEIFHTSEKDGHTRTARVTGLYRYNDTLYAIEEDRAKVSVDEFYRHGIDVPPVVVTLTETKAIEHLGDPEKVKGYTTQGSLEEWTVIADCYFEALAEA